MDHAPNIGQKTGPALLRLLGVHTPDDDFVERSPPVRRRVEVPGINMHDDGEAAVPAIVIGSRGLLPAAFIYDLQSAPTSSRYRLSVDEEDLVSQHELRLASTRDGSAATVIPRQPPVEALKSSAPSPEVNVRTATRGFVSKARAVQSASVLSPTMSSAGEGDKVVKAAVAIHTASRTAGTSMDKLLPPAVVIDVTPPNEVPKPKFTSREWGKPSPKIPAEARESGVHIVTGQVFRMANTSPTPISSAPGPSVVACLAGPPLSTKPLPALPADTSPTTESDQQPPHVQAASSCSAATTSSGPGQRDPGEAGCSSFRQAANIAAANCRPSSPTRRLHQSHLSPSVLMVLAERHGRPAPEWIVGRDHYERLLLAMYDDWTGRGRAPLLKAHPRLGNLKSYAIFFAVDASVHTPTRSQQHTSDHPMGQRSGHLIPSDSAPRLDTRRPSTDTSSSVTGSEYESMTDSSRLSQFPATATAVRATRRKRPTSTRPSSEQDVASDIQSVSLYDEFVTHGITGLQNFTKTSVLILKAFNGAERRYVQRQVGDHWNIIFTPYRRRYRKVVVPENAFSDAKEAFKPFGCLPVVFDKHILLDRGSLETYVAERRKARSWLKDARATYENVVPPLRSRIPDDIEYKRALRDWKQQQDFRRDLKMRAVVKYVYIHRKIEIYLYSREVMLEEMEDDEEMSSRRNDDCVQEQVGVQQPAKSREQAKSRDQEESECSTWTGSVQTPQTAESGGEVRPDTGASAASVPVRRVHEASGPSRDRENSQPGSSVTRPHMTRPVSVISDALGNTALSSTTRPVRKATQMSERLCENDDRSRENSTSSAGHSKILSPALTTAGHYAEFAASQEKLSHYHPWTVDSVPTAASATETRYKGHARRQSADIAKALSPKVAATFDAFSRSVDNLLSSMSRSAEPLSTGKDPTSPTFKVASGVTRRRSFLKLFPARKEEYVYKEDFAPVEHIAHVATTSPPIAQAPVTPGLDTQSPRIGTFSDTEYTLIQVEGISRARTVEEQQFHLQNDLEAALQRNYALLPRREKLKRRFKQVGRKFAHRLQDAADMAMGKR